MSEEHPAQSCLYGDYLERDLNGWAGGWNMESGHEDRSMVGQGLRLSHDYWNAGADTAPGICEA